MHFVAFFWDDSLLQGSLILEQEVDVLQSSMQVNNNSTRNLCLGSHLISNRPHSIHINLSLEAQGLPVPGSEAV